MRVSRAEFAKLSGARAPKRKPRGRISGRLISTPVASLMWQCRYAKLPEFNGEVPFHPRRKWRWDLAWPTKMIAVEVQGGTWAGGRHTRGAGYENDCEKLNAGVLLGWRVFWFTTAMVNDGRALATLQAASEKVIW